MVWVAFWSPFLLFSASVGVGVLLRLLPQDPHKESELTCLVLALLVTLGGYLATALGCVAVALAAVAAAPATALVAFASLGVLTALDVWSALCAGAGRCELLLARQMQRAVGLAWRPTS